MPLPDKIYLIGMPGSGKSTLGVELAKLIDRPFLDLDASIEQAEEQTISKIFRDKGEGYFRKLEHQLLKNHTQNERFFVMSTGGGAPCFYQGIDYMLANGKVLFLDVSTNQLVKRLEKQYQSRPKFKGNKAIEEQLNELAEQRLPIYRKAHIVLSEDNASVEQLLEAVKG